MNIFNVEGLQDYTIEYDPENEEGKFHACSASLMYQGYLIVLEPENYKTLEEAVRALKYRLTKASRDFTIPVKDKNHPLPDQFVDEIKWYLNDGKDREDLPF